MGTVKAKCVDDFVVGDILTTAAQGRLKKLDYTLLAQYIVQPATMEIALRSMNADHAIALTECINNYVEVKIK